VTEGLTLWKQFKAVLFIPLMLTSRKQKLHENLARSISAILNSDNILLFFATEGGAAAYQLLSCLNAYPYALQELFK